MTESSRGSTQPEPYQPPQVEDVASEHAPIVTAAGDSPGDQDEPA